MTILNLGTYPPKQCGIATFSMDLRKSLLLQGYKVQVLAVSDDDNGYRYPDEVVLTLLQNQKQDYRRAANFVNTTPDVELVIVQHEYGIYGGADGEYLLELVRLLRKPFVLIAHTILPQPSEHQSQILTELCQLAAGIVCMTRQSAQMLIDLYAAPPDLVTVIAHGVPLFKRYPQYKLKQKHNLQGHQLVSTFGLIGPGKGLEIGIRALAAVVPRHPSVRYLILGKTHPALQKREGEKYRQMLIDLVEELNIEENVIFINKFLTDKELGEYLYMTDIYLSPYPNMDQAVSGTMAFALGCGCAMVSTPYAYAREALADGRGLLTKGTDPLELAALIAKILDDPQLQRTLQEKAYLLGERMTWPNVGKDYKRLFRQILGQRTEQAVSRHNYARL
jgi:glycosyltransferase involved in cell wall biosynthesis